MIHKSELPGKFVEYIDEKGMTRIRKVAKVRGQTLSVIVLGRKKCKPVNKRKILCNIHHGHCRREIDWSIVRKKKGDE